MKRMRPTVFHRDAVAQLLRQRTVATLPDLVAALGGPSPRTVVRKLKQLSYLSSYSHGGRYYALPESARFDADGLWSHAGVRFSAHGTLLATAEALVRAAPLGWRPQELDARLGVSTINALRQLVRQGRLARVKVRGRALYCSVDATRRQRQRAARRAAAAEPLPRPRERSARTEALAAAFALLLSVLNEKQRRLFAGLLSMLYGHGGDTRVAPWVGLNRKTVRKGRRELASGQVDGERVRKPGGGRKPLEKKSLR